MLNSKSRIFPALFLMLVSSHFFRIAGISPAHAQAAPPPTRVNPDFSRIYIFVDKSGVVKKRG